MHKWNSNIHYMYVNISEEEVRAPLGSNRVVSLSKAHLLPKSTGNTQEAVAPSQYYMTENFFTGTLRINQPTIRRRDKIRGLV